MRGKFIDMLTAHDKVFDPVLLGEINVTERYVELRLFKKPVRQLPY